ncbi:MAG: hypothetical protein U5K69_08070 [Balneolaceae bacterium]|nr:hypothetical protein [Balneolaceae bacterium]
MDADYAEIIRSAFGSVKRQLSEVKRDLQFYEAGTVLSISEGVVRVDGLPGAKLDELLEFPDGVSGYGV